MNRLNSHFLRPSPTRSRDVSGDGQSALVVKLGVSLSRSRLHSGSRRYHQGIVQQAQGRSSQTALPPDHNHQSTNTAAMHDVLTIYAFTQMEPIFISGKCKFSAKNNAIIRPEPPVKNAL
jgi:hypothetical protein